MPLIGSITSGDTSFISWLTNSIVLSENNSCSSSADRSLYFSLVGSSLSSHQYLTIPFFCNRASLNQLCIRITPSLSWKKTRLQYSVACLAPSSSPGPLGSKRHNSSDWVKIRNSCGNAPSTTSATSPVTMDERPSTSLPYGSRL